MATDIIPEPVRQFILENIDSIAQMEGLLLFRAQPHTPWDVATLSQRLYISAQEAQQLLLTLHARGFLVPEKDKTGCYCYRPITPELAHMVDQVSEAYRQYLVPVTYLIHSKSSHRLQQFADAFKWRKD